VAASVRTCIGCRRKADAASLARLVLAPDGSLSAVPSRGGHPGRGASLHPTEACVRAAIAADAFVRAFRGRRPSRDGRPSSVEDVLRCLQVISPVSVPLSPSDE